MTLSLPLPLTQADRTATFFDASSAIDWLGRQPQANASAMLSELLRQIQAYNSYQTPPRQRFKTLEALRKTIFAVSGECQRRYQSKPFPLLPAEQATLDAVRALWRACAVGYMHCLQACLDNDSSITSDGVKVAHRVLACLRMEQMNGYLASTEPVSRFWLTVHAVFAAAERLGVTLEPVEDRLLGETSESTVSAQYCMTLLLHMAGPFALPRSHFFALSRWLARWREQAKLVARPDADAKSSVALDLEQDRPLHDNQRAAAVPRWLSLNNVLRKIRKRLEMLEAGESPESLKLGSGLSSEVCISLLNQLTNHLRYPPQAAAEELPGSTSVTLAAGLENIHQALGGRGLIDPLALSMSASRLRADQLAIFGHVVDPDLSGDAQTEQWQLLKQESGELELQRSRAGCEARMMLKSLLAVKLPSEKFYSLAMVRQLSSSGEGADARLKIVVALYPGEPLTLVVEIREKGNDKKMRFPAFVLAAESEKKSRLASIIVPAGITARALTIKFYESREQLRPDLQLAEFVERYADSELWLLRGMPVEG